MSTQLPDPRTVRSALELAARAPSLNNSQPWRWRIGPATVHLYADGDRRLAATDPTGRELVISCGAILHHARVAFASLGWRADVHRLPNPAEPDHLAAIEFSRNHGFDEAAVRLADAISRRHTDRRPFLPEPVPAASLAALARAAGAEGSKLTIATTQAMRRELVIALAQANTEQRGNSAYQAELAAWAGRSHVAGDGVPATSLRAPDPYHRGVFGRDFSGAGAGTLVSSPVDDGAALAVLSAPMDDRRSWLQTGEALSAVLLEATVAGLATCTLSQIAESRAARDTVRFGVLRGDGEPLVAVRIGWPVTATFPAPLTRRRSVDEFVDAMP